MWRGVTRLNRKIHIDDKVWRYRISNGNLIMCTPSGKRHFANQCTVLGLEPHIVERARWKRTSNGNVTPAVIKDYILANFDKLG